MIVGPADVTTLFLAPPVCFPWYTRRQRSTYSGTAGLGCTRNGKAKADLQGEWGRWKCLVCQLNVSKTVRTESRTDITMPETLPGIWQEFRTRFHRAGEQLATEMVSAGNDVCLLIDQLQNQLASSTPGSLDPGKTDSLEQLFGDMEKRLFGDPLGAYTRRRPLQKTLSAIERHRWEMNELTSRLPVVITVSGAELVDALGTDIRGGWRKPWLARRKSPRPLRLREIAAAHVQSQFARRVSIDGSFELVLAQAGLHLVAAWQIYRRHRLKELATGDHDQASLSEEWKWWSRTAVVLKGRIGHLVAAYRKWFEAYPVFMARAILRRTPEISEHRQAELVEQWQGSLGHWHRQARAVFALIDLETQLSLLSLNAIQEVREALDSLRAEHDAVTGELDGVITQLQEGIEHQKAEALPPPKSGLLSAEQRARDWAERFSSRIQSLVPISVEAVRPRRPLPGRRKPWRELQPRQALLNALGHSGVDTAREGFRVGEIEHIAVIRDIEQARQVVNFALETGRAEGENVEGLPDEAASNAVGLLQHRKEILIDPLPAAESGLCRAQALTFLQTHTALEIGRLGLLALLTRQSAPHAVEGLGQVALGVVRSASRNLWEVIAKIRSWISLKLGLEIPATPQLKPVVERPRLSVVLETQLKPQELPALYQRLFRLAPVEDLRFLVGREVEMSGLNRAHARWRAGANISVLVVGARGSGKTSLLNCAASEVFRDLPLRRGQFGPRIRSSVQMAEFVRNLFELPAGTELESALNATRQVAIIEEFERTFLRCMNGFQALRDFLRLIAATSSSTLWVLSMNQTSFDYLDAVEGLGRNFSHRINAMSVSQAHLTAAILQRHTLSGLRLHFAPNLGGDRSLILLRRFLGLESTSQQLFFDALYRQSEGIFRSAFDMWLGSIDRVEGGVVRMHHPVDPSYGRLEDELKPDDFFTLHTILQHGSLTAEELAEVFRIELREANPRLERLLALEILEPEPNGPGLRVRPQAGRFVRDALARQNLV